MNEKIEKLSRLYIMFNNKHEYSYYIYGNFGTILTIGSSLYGNSVSFSIICHPFKEEL